MLRIYSGQMYGLYYVEFLIVLTRDARGHMTFPFMTSCESYISEVVLAKIPYLAVCMSVLILLVLASCHSLLTSTLGLFRSI